MSTTKKQTAPTKEKSAKAPASISGLTISDLTKKQASTRFKKVKASSLKMRKKLWPTVTDDQLWLRENKDLVKGFTTLPRTMPLLMNLINDLSKQVAGGKAVPAGKAYLVLWCRVFDEGFLKIDSEPVAAMEAGYIGERNVTTWREHLRVLKELGFIDTKAGPAGPNQYILLWNPHHAVTNLHQKGWVQEQAYIALYQRALEIGATEFDDEEPSNDEAGV